MSKLKLKTKEKILAKALEMFNIRGIEYVGLRELAALLDMRVSNITYYFPTKDDLVNELSVQLNALNSEIIIQKNQITIVEFLEMLHKVFQNHVKYRCLLLSFVHLMDQNKIMAERYKKTESTRNETLRSNINSLMNSGYLRINEEVDLDYIVSTIALIVRFWISEAQVSFRHVGTDQQINHYLSLIIRLLRPFATRKAGEEMKVFKDKMQPKDNGQS